MDFSNIFSKKQEIEKHSLGVCIPEHRTTKLVEQEKVQDESKPHITAGTPLQKKNAAQELLNSKEGHFKVTGSYRVLDTLMLLGVVEKGIVRKRMVSEYNGKQIKISEVRHGNEEIEQIMGGQEGTIFITSKLTPIINSGQILDFKG
jgi:hypothetical protein